MSSFLIHLLILSVEISNKEGTVERENSCLILTFKLNKLFQLSNTLAYPLKLWNVTHTVHLI